MEVRPDHRAEEIEVVQHHQEARVGSVEHEEETWQDDVVVDLSESLHPSGVLWRHVDPEEVVPNQEVIPEGIRSCMASRKVPPRSERSSLSRCVVRSAY